MLKLWPVSLSGQTTDPLSVAVDKVKDKLAAFAPLAVLSMFFTVLVLASDKDSPVGVPGHELALSITAAEEDSLLQQVLSIGEQADDVLTLQSHAVILSWLGPRMRRSQLFVTVACPLY